jgi:hypothetical protein
MLTTLRKRSRGSILLLVLFLLIILAMMGSAFAILLPVEMSNAKRDRANIQTAYAADAGVLWVMEQFDTNDAFREADGWNNLEGETQVLSSEWEWRVASVDKLEGEEAYRVVTEGIRKRGSQRDVLRRAVAIIDNGLRSDQPAILLSASDVNGNSPMGGNPNTYWPGDVPIYGDVIVAGHWAVDDGAIDFNNGPTFTGTVTQTVGGGSALRGESYKSNDLTVDQYDDAYTNGIDGVQTVDAGDLSESIFLESNATRQRLQESLFSTNDTSIIDTMNDTTANSNGIHIPLNSAGKPNGGVIVNSGGGNGDEYDLVFSTDANGNSIMNYTGDALNSINTIEANAPGTLDNVSNTTTSGNFQIIHVSDGTSFNSNGEERLVIRNATTNTILYNEEAEFGTGSVVYNHGSLNVQGTYSGEKTVAATLGVTITGELMKDRLPRGMTTPEALADGNISEVDKEKISNSLLGLICNIEAGNASQGFRFDINNVDPDGQVYIHSSLMGLSKTNVNTKMFGNNIGHNLPNNAKVHIYGQLATGPTNAGQFKKEIEFFKASMAAFTMDNLPGPWPPSSGDRFRSNLRAYVDQQSYDSE